MEFQYISCYCLSSSFFKKSISICISIHLMLLFIDSFRATGKRTLQISIHLMLLFIGKFNLKNSKLLLFQYISCYCLSPATPRTPPHTANFNTSHVTVYLVNGVYYHHSLLEFQYISCYCLSKQNFLRVRRLSDFNTSHVTVYRLFKAPHTVKIIFQYISCYCLSKLQKKFLFHRRISIHLMLLFIWHIPFITDFNRFISIHLMLLFISIGFASNFPFSSFQYISCYCLSRKTTWHTHRYPHFNTSHVTVYRYFTALSNSRISISIHLMLLFIDREKEQKAEEIYYFNTSHVTVYPYAVFPSGFSVSFQYISCYCLSVFSATFTFL